MRLRWTRRECALLLNLLSNAVKFTPTVVAWTCASLHPEGRLRSGADHGPGVPADKRHLLLKIFVQLAPQGIADGQGMALASPYQLAWLP